VGTSFAFNSEEQEAQRHLRRTANGEAPEARKKKWKDLENNLIRYLFLCTWGEYYRPYTALLIFLLFCVQGCIGWGGGWMGQEPVV